MGGFLGGVPGGLKPVPARSYLSVMTLKLSSEIGHSGCDRLQFCLLIQVEDGFSWRLQEGGSEEGEGVASERRK